MKGIKEFYVGQKAYVKTKITEKDIEAFVNLTGDDNKLHVDKEYASTTDYKKPVAHGMISASFISTLIGTKLPGDGALWYKQSIEFVNPVYVGEALVVEGEILKIIVSSSTLVLKTIVSKDDGTPVIRGEAHVKVLEQNPGLVKENNANQKRKRVIVLGSTGGLGSKIAEKLAAEGYNLTLHYNGNKVKADALKAKLLNYDVSITTLKADLNNEEEVMNLVESLRSRHSQELYGMCFAISPRIHLRDFIEFSVKELESSLRIELFGLYRLLKLLSIEPRFPQYLRFIYISSTVTDRPNPNWLAYNVTKASAEALVKTYALHFAKNGGTANIIAPGLMETELTNFIPKHVKLFASKSTPIKRLTETEDIANYVLFLMSDKSSGLTGQKITIDGGKNLT